MTVGKGLVSFKYEMQKMSGKQREDDRRKYIYMILVDIVQHGRTRITKVATKALEASNYVTTKAGD